MRISMKWKELPSACEIFEFGEVEDYSIFISPSTGVGPCAQEKIHASNFEDGWGIWIDGGEDCRRSLDDHQYARSGKYCVRLRDNSETSLMTTENMNLEDFENIKVKFSFIDERPHKFIVIVKQKNKSILFMTCVSFYLFSFLI